jgi:hypothetical protein
MRIALLALFGLISCASPGSEDLGSQSFVSIQDSASYYFSRIDSGLVTSVELELAKKYFISQDSLVVSDPKRLMQAGLVLMSGGKDYLYGVNYLIILTKKYPKHRFAPEALMQLALFFENRFGDQERSNNYLYALINRYPNHALTEQAKSLLSINADELNTIQNWLNKK